MMLQGEAKRDYQREYMRRKRAGEPTRKPPKPWEPTQRMVDDVGHWFWLRRDRPWLLRGIGSDVVDGLDPTNPDGTRNEVSWTEALQRYRTLRAERRAKRKNAEPEPPAHAEPEPPARKRCSFCRQPASDGQVLVASGDNYSLICATCTKEAAALFAKHRRQRAARR